MAENDNKPPEIPRKEDLPVAVAVALFECRLGLASAVMGARTLAVRHNVDPLKSELDVLTRLLDQVNDAFETLALALEQLFQPRASLN